MVHIPDIQIELLFPRKGVPPVDLRPPGDARFNLMPPHLFRGVPVQVSDEQRPRADEAHVPLDNVDERRKFVEAGTPQDATEPGKPIPVGKRIPLGIPLFGHRAELVHHEGFPVQTRPGLPEEDRRPEDGSHNKVQHQHCRKQNYYRGNRDRQIERPLPESEVCCSNPSRHPDQRGCIPCVVPIPAWPRPRSFNKPA